MTQVLAIEASHNQHSNGSKYIASLIEKRLERKYPEAKFIRHDYAASPLPHLETATVQAFFTPPEQQSGAQKQAIERSNELAAELLASDILLLSMPMWNFGVPSAIKAWIDHVVRAGITFSYTPAGVKGSVESTRAILVAASGGVFSDGPMSAWDHLVPYMTHILSFVGITDIQVVRLEGTLTAPEDALANAEKAIHDLIL